MVPDPGRVIVATGDRSSVSMECTAIHHRDFPEVRGQGDSTEDAAARLVELLSRALDSAPSHWRRGLLERAIEDVRALLVARGHSSGQDRPSADRQDEGG